MWGKTPAPTQALRQKYDERPVEGPSGPATWAAESDFTLADCAAAPSLFYADWAHRIPEAYPVLGACRARLLARPSFARAVDEERYFRPFFPLGAPDRD